MKLWYDISMAVIRVFSAYQLSQLNLDHDIDTPMGISGEHQHQDGWMNGVLGHFYALSRLNWAGDNLG